jgi:hypothetical protein
MSYSQAQRHLQECLRRDESYYMTRFQQSIGNVKLPVSIQRAVVEYDGHEQSQSLYGINVDGPFQYAFPLNLTADSDTFANFIKGVHRGFSQGRVQEHQDRLERTTKDLGNNLDLALLRRRVDGAFKIDKILFEYVEEVPLSAASANARGLVRIVCRIKVAWAGDGESNNRSRSCSPMSLC